MVSISPSLFSFFAGAGFLDLGFEASNFIVDFVNEVHEPFLDAYYYARSNMCMEPPKHGKHLGSVEELLIGIQKRRLTRLIAKSRSANDIVGFIGGPPCPDFSVGGKNRGRNGDNGRLSASYIELICQQKPDFFLFENVKGLWRTKKHRRFFEELKLKLHESGYVTTQKLINALEYGVPQDRERIILIGFYQGFLSDMGYNASSRAELPNGLFPWEKHIRASKDYLLSLPWPSTNPFREDSTLPCPSGIKPELTVEYWFEKNQVLNHFNAEHHFKPRAAKTRFEQIDEGDVSKKSFKRLHRWRYSPTAAYGNNEVHLHPYKPRRISASEAMALQSLPKDFILPPDMSLSNMFKAIGNGVPFLAAKGLAESIMDFLGGNIDDKADGGELSQRNQSAAERQSV